MGIPSKGSVVLIPFPFSDLSKSKLRPAVVLASSGKGDWILCQITSQPYTDPRAVELSNQDFQIGSLRIMSFARPGKLFTANESLIVSEWQTKYTARELRGQWSDQSNHPHPASPLKGEEFIGSTNRLRILCAVY